MMFLTAAKNQTEAARLEFSLPSEWRLLENIQEVLAAQNGIVGLAVWNMKAKGMMNTTAAMASATTSSQ